MEDRSSQRMRTLVTLQPGQALQNNEGEQNISFRL
jgi:hypothetical protein